MHNSQAMQIVHTLDHLENNAPCKRLIESVAAILQKIVQIFTLHEVHHNLALVTLLNHVVRPNHKGMINHS